MVTVKEIIYMRVTEFPIEDLIQCIQTDLHTCLPRANMQNDTCKMSFVLNILLVNVNMQKKL